MASSSILKGIRVVDMTSVIFGPYCTATLAEMGADVIKLEPSRGDEVRRVGKPVKTRGMGPGHMTFNRGKRSITWDLKTEKGKSDLLRLLGKSQVFIHNLRKEAIERLGLDYASVKALYPGIVYVHCSGFGSAGQYGGLAAYDDIIQARSGAAGLLPLVDGNPAPRYLPMAIADKVSGLHAVYAVLGALLYRERSGEGLYVEVPMFESFTHFLMQEHLYGGTFVPPNDSVGYPRQLDPLRQPLRTQDGYIAVAPYTDERWIRFFEVTGNGDFLGSHGLTTARLRFAGLDQMQAEMARILLDHTTAYWLDLLARHDIPASPVRRLDEVLEDPHLASIGFFHTRHHPTEGDYIEMQPPVKFGVPEGPELRMPPFLGQHNDEVLHWLEEDSGT